MTSVELNRELGAFVLERVATKVDLRQPELEIHVEVMPAETFVYVDPEPGPGGLPGGRERHRRGAPVGGDRFAGRGLAMMKRGCRVVFVHFHSVPYLPPTSQAKARAFVTQLTEWQYDSTLVPGALRRDPARGRADRAAARAGRDFIGG